MCSRNIHFKQNTRGNITNIINIITEMHRKGKCQRKLDKFPQKNTVKSFMGEVKIKKMLILFKHEERNDRGLK